MEVVDSAGKTKRGRKLSTQHLAQTVCSARSETCRLLQFWFAVPRMVTRQKEKQMIYKIIKVRPGAPPLCDVEVEGKTYQCIRMVIGPDGWAPSVKCILDAICK